MPDDLLATAIEAAGGQKLWNTLRSLTIDLSIGGPLWTMNGWPPGATFNQPMTLNTVDERNECTMLVPNHLERDTAIRVPGGDGRVDSVSEVKPVETFGGEAVIERIMTSTLSPPASSTQGLVAIDPLCPAGEYWTRNREVITNAAGVAVAELSVGLAPCAPT